MSTSCDVSVVITCFNQGKTLAHAVSSACKQSLRPRCITIVDDGSNDLVTQSVIDELSEPDSAVSAVSTGIPLRVIHQENAGVSAARNAGIDAATGTVVAILDGDDFWEPRFLEETCASLGNEHTIAASSWLQTFGVLSTIVKPTGGPLTAFLARNCCPASCVFTKTSWEEAGGYDTSMRSGFEDWDFSLRLLESASLHGDEIATIDIVPQALLHYRTAAVSPNITSMNHRLEIMRTLITHHKETYRAHVAEAITGVEEISIHRLTALGALASRHSEIQVEATFGDGGMAAAVRLASHRAG